MDICVNGEVVNFLIDMGSSINVISNKIYEGKLQDVVLKKTNLKCMPFTSKIHVELKGKLLAAPETKRNFISPTICHCR